MTQTSEHNEQEPVGLPIGSEDICTVLKRYEISAHQVQGQQNFRYDDRTQHPKLLTP